MSLLKAKGTPSTSIGETDKRGCKAFNHGNTTACMRKNFHNLFQKKKIFCFDKLPSVSVSIQRKPKPEQLQRYKLRSLSVNWGRLISSLLIYMINGCVILQGFHILTCTKLSWLKIIRLLKLSHKYKNRVYRLQCTAAHWLLNFHTDNPSDVHQSYKAMGSTEHLQMTLTLSAYKITLWQMYALLCPAVWMYLRDAMIKIKPEKLC